MKRHLSVILGLLIVLVAPAIALAEEHVTGGANWYVEYNKAGQVVDNYSVDEWADNVSQMQPGDDITLTIEVRQTNDGSADWYLSNAVLKSLEDGDASGSAYGYTLSYEGPSNSRVLYTSKSIGGIGSQAGLAEATNAMDDYFFLGTLSKGQKGKVKLNVALDGETEGNAYFDTFAQLSMKFAVEPNVTSSPSPTPSQKTTTNTVTKDKVEEKTETVTKDKVIERTRTVDDEAYAERDRGASTNRVITEDRVVEEIVTVDNQEVINRVIPGNRENLAKTGDPTTQLPLYLGIAGLGVVCLALAIRNIRNKKKDEGGAK